MKRSLVSFAGILIFLFLWAAGARLLVSFRGAVPIPGPGDVLIRLGELFSGEAIYGSTLKEHLSGSLLLWLKGLLLGLLIGVPLGIGTGCFETLRLLLLPFLSVLQVIPGMAWIPVALLLFGIGPGATVFMITVTALPPVVFNTQAAVRDIPVVYRRASSMMELGPVKNLFHVYLPAVSPGLLTGVRLGFAASWRVLIAAEMIVGTNRGIGFSILQARWTLDYPSALAFICLIALFGLFFEKLVFEPLERSLRIRRGLAG